MNRESALQLKAIVLSFKRAIEDGNYEKVRRIVAANPDIYTLVCEYGTKV